MSFNESPSRISDTFAARPPLSEWSKARLIERGIPEAALNAGPPLRVGYVHYVGQGAFEFDEYRPQADAVRVLLSLVCDGSGTPIDIVAWDPHTNRTATWLQRAHALGQEQFYAPRLSEDGALLVYRSPREWLCAQRQGVVFVRPRIHRCSLIGISPLRAADPRFRGSIRRHFTCPALTIL